MQSITTNNLFMHEHEKWGASDTACPHPKNVRRQLPPCHPTPPVPRSMSQRPLKRPQHLNHKNNVSH